MRKLRLLFVVVPMALASVSSASPVVVTHQIGALNGAGSFYAFFGLTDGAAAPIPSASVRITDLSLVGGTLSAAPDTAGSYDALPNGFRLTDDGGFGAAAFSFTVASPGAVLSFTFDSAQTQSYADDPDYFVYTLLDSNRAPLATTGPLGEELVGAELDRASTTAIPYDPIRDGSPLSGVVAPKVQAVPEPATLAAFGLGAVGALRRRKGKR